MLVVFKNLRPHVLAVLNAVCNQQQHRWGIVGSARSAPPRERLAPPRSLGRGLEAVIASPSGDSMVH